MAKGEDQCSKCSGTGKIECPDCGGYGINRESQSWDNVRCPKCNGNGEVICPKCGGTSRQTNGKGRRYSAS